ncbi:MAG: hypothetical protein EOM91_10185 [Sphingobacteriia bacterium]|nr:hypothetical protein [Sphingobacteriia bacterium]
MKRQHRGALLLCGALASTSVLGEGPIDTQSKRIDTPPDRTSAPPLVSPVQTLEMPLPTPASIPSGGFPALGVGPSKTRAVSPAVVNLVPGVTTQMDVSLDMPNRIATPFESPKVIDTSGAQVIINGSDVFILPANEAPFSVFITDNDPGNPVAALTLTPKDSLASQSLMLQIDRTENGFNARDGGLRGEEREYSVYSSYLVYLMRSVAMGTLPKGFVEAQLNVPNFSIGPVRGTPSKRWAGTRMDIYRYDLTNSGSEWVELTEQSIYETGIKAVSFFPRVRLSPGESTYAFVIAEGRADPAARR